MPCPTALIPFLLTLSNVSELANAYVRALVRYLRDSAKRRLDCELRLAMS